LYQKNLDNAKVKPQPAENSRQKNILRNSPKVNNSKESVQPAQNVSNRYLNNPDENETMQDFGPANAESVWQPELGADVFLSALMKKQQNYLNHERSLVNQVSNSLKQPGVPNRIYNSL